VRREEKEYHCLLLGAGSQLKRSETFGVLGVHLGVVIQQSLRIDIRERIGAPASGQSHQSSVCTTHIDDLLATELGDRDDQGRLLGLVDLVWIGALLQLCVRADVSVDTGEPGSQAELLLRVCAVHMRKVATYQELNDLVLLLLHCDHEGRLATLVGQVELVRALGFDLQGLGQHQHTHSNTSC
jgi:hypothetical protein